MRSHDMCSSVALDVIMSSWFDLLLLLYTYTVTAGAKAKAWSTAAVVSVLLYCFVPGSDFVAPKLRSFW